MPRDRYKIEIKVNTVRDYIDRENKKTISDFQLSYPGFQQWLRDKEVLEGVSKITGLTVYEIERLIERKKLSTREIIIKEQRRRMHSFFPYRQ